MMICAFQQDGIPEAITQAQVNAYGRMYIRDHSFYSGMYQNRFHALQLWSNKKPRSYGASEYHGTNHGMTIQNPLDLYATTKICCSFVSLGYKDVTAITNEQKKFV